MYHDNVLSNIIAVKVGNLKTVDMSIWRIGANLGIRDIQLINWKTL